MLSYLPKYYGEQVENSRAFLASYDSPFSDKKSPINWAHSSGIMDYTCFQYDKFKDVKLDSYKSIDTSRGFKERDILFLIFVEFHELSHQRQRIQMNNENSMDATAYEAKIFLNDIGLLSAMCGLQAKTIIEGNIDEVDISLDGEVEFKKSGDLLEIRRI